MHHFQRKSRRFVYRTGGFIVLLWAAHGSIFPFRCTGRRSDGPAARHGESSTKRRSAPEWISSHRAFQSFSSCIFCRSSSSRTRHLPSTGGSAKPSSPADRCKTSCPRSRASASAVLLKPQGGAEKENAPSGHEALKAFRDGGFNGDLRLVSSSVKHNGMVLSRIAPLHTLKRKCKSYRSMRKQTKRRRSVHFFLTG